MRANWKMEPENGTWKILIKSCMIFHIFASLFIPNANRCSVLAYGSYAICSTRYSRVGLALWADYTKGFSLDRDRHYRIIDCWASAEFLSAPSLFERSRPAHHNQMLFITDWNKPILSEITYLRNVIAFEQFHFSDQVLRCIRVQIIEHCMVKAPDVLGFLRWTLQKPTLSDKNLPRMLEYCQCVEWQEICSALKCNGGEFKR